MLEVSNVFFKYPNQNFPTIDFVSFKINTKHNLAIVGESGCGKSTLLKLIYGLLDVNEGEIYWNKELVTGPKFNLVPGMEKMKYLAQDFDLMPYTTVAENVGSFLSNFFPKDKKSRVEELLKVVEMETFSNTKVKYLSGGQMQRVAIAKVLAKEPELLLLDEPFSHIDNFRKNSLRRNIFKYLKEKAITCVIATHDINDSLSFADEVLVIKNGALVKKAKTFEVYNDKSNKYMASLFDDVSEIKIEGKKRLFYPHELEIVEKSEIKVVVNKSFFKGSHYLIEGKESENNVIYFKSEKLLNSEQEVFLKPKK